MYAARLRLESGVKRFGFQVEPTFMAGAWMSNDIHVDTAVVMLGRLRSKNMRLIDIC